MAADTTRQKRGILVFWRHDHAVAVELVKVLGECQRHPGAVPGERGVEDGVLLHLG
jgi:hypothetical protein